MNKIVLNESAVPSDWRSCGTAAEDYVHERHSSAEGPRISSTLMSSGTAAEAVCPPLPIVSRKQGAGASASTFLLRSLLRRVIRKGTLTLVTPDGCACDIGHGEPSVTIRVTDRATVRRLFLNPDLALGEAYMDGTLVVEGGGVHDLLDLCLANLGWDTGHWVQRARSIGRRLGRRLAQHNPVSISRANVAHHYDLSDVLYELFLDADRQYSCAYYLSPDDTLEQAQDQKKRHIAAKLLLRAGQRVLDIGSGWGGLALHLARNADIDVTGVTLSTEQHGYASRRANDVGLSDRVRFLLKDYRHENGRYDRIVSVGMFEHVGVGHYGEYFEKIKDLLADDGVALIHTIGSAAGLGAANPWILQIHIPRRIHAGALRDRASHRARWTSNHRHRGPAAALRGDAERLAQAVHGQP
uniref:SAM-dependent methyltransferase n=1 Tax=Mesorhizobium atlanticum TaxID=2233532 RepID=UPI003704C2A9